jgi:hypothetical protein
MIDLARAIFRRLFEFLETSCPNMDNAITPTVATMAAMRASPALFRENRLLIALPLLRAFPE